MIDKSGYYRWIFRKLLFKNGKLVHCLPWHLPVSVQQGSRRHSGAAAVLLAKQVNNIEALTKPEVMETLSISLITKSLNPPNYCSEEYLSLESTLVGPFFWLHGY